MLFERTFFPSLLHLSSNEKKLFDEYCVSIIAKFRRMLFHAGNLTFVCNMVIRFWISFLFDEHVHLCMYVCMCLYDVLEFVFSSFLEHRNEVIVQSRKSGKLQHKWNILCRENIEIYFAVIRIFANTFNCSFIFFHFPANVNDRKITCTINSCSVFRFIWYSIWGFHYGCGHRPKNTNK